MSTAPLPFGVFYGVRYPYLVDKKKSTIQNYAKCKLCRQPFLLDSSGSEICGRLSCYLDQLMRSASFVSKLRARHEAESLLRPDYDSIAWWAAQKLQEEEDRRLAVYLGLPIQSQVARERVKEVRHLGRISRRRSRGRGHQASGRRPV